MEQEQPRLTLEQALAIVAEIKRRESFKTIDLVDPKFPSQAAFVTDTARKVAAKCTRRAGKTEGVARRLIRRCLKQDGVAVLYVGLTRDSCRRIFWEDALKPLLGKKKIPSKLNETRLECRFPNASRIYCLGMDVDKEEMKKLLGGKYAEVVIDEAGSFRIDLTKLVYEILGPATADYLGTIALTGTPEDLTSGLFYEVTRDDDVPRRADWSVHEWTTYDNPYMVKQWEIEIESLLAANPRMKETPMFQRMYLGHWVIDQTRLVYKYRRDRNWIEALPYGDYVYGLGVDLGFNDDTAFVLSAYSSASRELYLLKPYKRSEMILSDVAERINWYRSQHEIYSIVIDGANRQAVEEMRVRFGLPLISADKAGKAEFIEIMNSEFILGHIKLVGDDANILEKEYLGLIWDDSKPHKREEHPNCPNHLADAALYVWRRQYQYLYKAPVEVPRKSAEQVIDKWVEDQSQFLKIANEKPFWERDF